MCLAAFHWSILEFEAPPILYQTVRAGSPLVFIPSIAAALSRSPIKKDLQKYISLPSSHEEIEEVNRLDPRTASDHCSRYPADMYSRKALRAVHFIQLQHVEPTP